MDPVRRQVQAIDRDQPVQTIQALSQVLANDRWWYRTWGSVFAAFAIIALVLSSVGLYAVMSYAVTRRTQEIGVRMAVGAQPRQVSWLILKRGLAQLAATANPKQREYAAALKQFCQRHNLGCGDEAWLHRFAAAARSGDKDQSHLASVSKLAETAPDTTYVEIMDTLQSVEAEKMARLDPAVFSVENQGETAIGYAKRAGTHPHQVSFVRSANGWMIAMPKP